MDICTQLQDALDTLGQEMYSALFYLNTKHDAAPFPDDVHAPRPPDIKGQVVRDPPETFKANQQELAHDIVAQAKQVALLIDALPGLDRTAAEQMARVEDLEEKLRETEIRHARALKEREALQVQTETLILTCTEEARKACIS